MAHQSLPVQLKGSIRHYQGLGRTLGYPTANINTDTDLDDGVYFGYANLLVFTHHPCLIFIGTPTTVGAIERRVEAYLLDIPDKDYYGEILSLEIIKFYRPNKTFKNVDALIQKMYNDESDARKWFSKHPQHL
jgi:riboflavin kinase/FMN adenylyltransferase